MTPAVAIVRRASTARGRPPARAANLQSTQTAAPASTPDRLAAPSTFTPPSRASRTTASTSSTVAAPLITYCRIASGEQPCLVSATTRNVSSTLDVSADNSRAAPAPPCPQSPLSAPCACTRACCRMSSVCRCSPNVRTCRSQRIDQRARNPQPAIGGQRRAQHLQIVQELLRRAVRRQRLRQLVAVLPQRVGHHRQRLARRSPRPAASIVRCTRAFRQITNRR